ncbi:MAG: GAF domain-containing sensor histidine kinase [Chloroflexota bacterium]
MATQQSTNAASLLPVHELLATFERWCADPSTERRNDLAASLERVAAAYGCEGVRLQLHGPHLPELDLSIGILVGAIPSVVQRDLATEPMAKSEAVAWLDGAPDATERMFSALQLAVGAVWSRQQARLAGRQLEALDLAVRGIASVQSVDRVLQVIVDRVRELAGAGYAALGIVGSFGRIDQFIVSGITPHQRVLLGAPPQGHGLLGLIIKEDRALLIDDIATDPRRYGFPEHHPEMHSLLGVPVRNRGATIGNLYLTNKLNAATFDEADLELVERFALHAGIAIKNARLQEEVGRLAIVDERQRISQDLHDSIIQSLYGISLSLEDLPEVITEDPTEGAARADRAIDGIHGSIRDIRNFIMGLQPEMLVDADLRAGLETLAAEFRANTLIDLELTIDPNLAELPRDHEAHLLSITREALSNIARHSNATRATINLAITDGSVTLVIGDNGRGFDISAARGARQRGLGNLRARAEAVGGKLELASTAGAGTMITATLPITEGPTDDS